MDFEREHHENLRFTLPEKREILREAVTIWMLEDEHLIGETYGMALDGSSGIPQGCPIDSHSIYCYSNTILGAYQSKGYGTILKAAFIARVAHDFRRIYGHARPGASQALNKKFGAQFLRTYKDWYGTGEDYQLYVLPLDNGRQR